MTPPVDGIARAALGAKIDGRNIATARLELQ
jgi:hypothetical protein